MAGWLIWIIVAGALLVVEMFTLTFYLLWLAVGACVGAVLSWLFPDQIVWQLLTGIAVSLALTLFTKPITRRIRSGGGYKDAVDELVGKEGIVVEAIASGKPGVVRVGSETWSAKGTEALEPGQTVTVVHRGTTMLEVQKRGG